MEFKKHSIIRIVIIFLIIILFIRNRLVENAMQKHQPKSRVTNHIIIEEKGSDKGKQEKVTSLLEDESNNIKLLESEKELEIALQELEFIDVVDIGISLSEGIQDVSKVLVELKLAEIKKLSEEQENQIQKIVKQFYSISSEDILIQIIEN